MATPNVLISLVLALIVIKAISVTASQKKLKLSLQLVVRQRYGITNYNDDDDATAIATSLKPNRQENVFLATIFIGNPPSPQLLVIDTGTSLTWVRCAPCLNCGNQLSELFDPRDSSTFTRISCRSSQCQYDVRGIRDRKCDKKNNCTFSMSYDAEKSRVKGKVVSEQISLRTPTDTDIKFPLKTLGCGHEDDMDLGEEISGILGLGGAEYSIVNQFGGNFSYCIHDRTYMFHKLIFGQGAWYVGPSTPIDIHDGRYYLQLLYITVGNKRLAINPDFFSRAAGYGGTIIDTGSTLTTLIRPAYDVLSAQVKSLIPVGLTQADQGDHLCYNGRIDHQAIANFVPVTFHFAGGATIVHGPGSLFRQASSNTFCLTVYPSSSGDPTTIIGIYSQQHYNFGFNQIQKKLYIDRVACEDLSH